MPRPVMFDCISSAQGAEQIGKELDAKEKWIKMNKNGIWQQAMGPIQGRVQAICEDKTELLRKLMDSKDEYFRFCKATPQPKYVDDTFIVRVGPDMCDECMRDPTIPMRTPPDYIRAIIFEGLAQEGPHSQPNLLNYPASQRYLKVRWDSGLPETRFCYPPTTNSEYSWKLIESVRAQACNTRPRINSIGPQFYRSRGVLCKADFAPYHFPRNYY